MSQGADNRMPAGENGEGALGAGRALASVTSALAVVRAMLFAHSGLGGGALGLCPGLEAPGAAGTGGNLTPTVAHVSCGERERLHGHQGAAVWITGLSASGKSTLAYALDLQLHRRGVATYVLDGDNLRMGLCSDLGFSAQDRAENLRRVGEVMRLFVDAGLVVICSFISPRRKDRLWLRERLSGRRFVEVFLRCPIEVCMARDPKGLYGKALRGEIRDFTGISAPYEQPENPELIIDSDRTPVPLAAARVIDQLERAGFLPAMAPVHSNPRLC